MWTAPDGKHFLDASNDLVGCGHMSGLLVRSIMSAGPDEVRLTEVPIKDASFALT
jgi:hypothetical protein